jgi:hypothetical protein
VVRPCADAPLTDVQHTTIAGHPAIVDPYGPSLSCAPRTGQTTSPHRAASPCGGEAADAIPGPLETRVRISAAEIIFVESEGLSSVQVNTILSQALAKP